MARILVVDDEQIYTRIIREILIDEEHSVETAEDYDSAISVVKDFEPDMLIVDLMLKGDNSGIILSRKLQTVFPQLKTILITGVSTRELTHELNESNISSVFQKPFDMGEILVGIQEILNET